MRGGESLSLPDCARACVLERIKESRDVCRFQSTAVERSSVFFPFAVGILEEGKRGLEPRREGRFVCGTHPSYDCRCECVQSSALFVREARHTPLPPPEGALHERLLPNKLVLANNAARRPAARHTLIRPCPPNGSTTSRVRRTTTRSGTWKSVASARGKRRGCSSASSARGWVMVARGWCFGCLGSSGAWPSSPRCGLCAPTAATPAPVPSARLISSVRSGG